MIAAVDIHHQGNAVSDLLPDALDQIEIVARIKGILPDFDLHGPEATLYKRSRRVERGLQAAEAEGRGIGRDALALLTAQEMIDRHAMRFAGHIPEGDID